MSAAGASSAKLVAGALLGLLLLSFGACTKKVPMSPSTAGLAAPGMCETVCAKRKSDDAACIQLAELCVEKVSRGWFRFDWSRVSLLGLGDDVANAVDATDEVRCVRVEQSNGCDLGYDAAGDRPNRRELELAPASGQVQFLVWDDPDDAQTASQALGNALGGYDFRIELFQRSCQELCRDSRGHTTIAFSAGTAKPAVSYADETLDRCGLMGARATPWSGSGGAPTAVGAGGSGGTAGASSDTSPAGIGGQGGAG
jgi:hypothetical protein